MCTRGAQWYEWYTQFLQVGRNNDRALILIGLTLYLPSASVSSVLKGHSGAELHIYFLVHLESIYYEIFFYSKIVPNCAVAK